MSVIGNINVMVGANTSGLTKGLGKAESEVGGFGKSIAGLVSSGAALATGFFGIGKALDMLTGGFKGAADMEQAEISFGVLFKSADTAKAVLSDLSQFAAETPFELPQLTEAARSLAAFGFEASSITPNLRMLGDIASGVNTPIGELSELYGKARVQGRLFAEDINQLTGRGIPITQALAKQFGVADDKVKKLVESGKIGFPQIEKAFQSMTGAGGQFNGMMAAQSQSLSGLWSTLQDSIGGTLRELSGKVIAALDIKGLIASFTAGMDTVKEVILSTGPFWTQALNNAKAMFDSVTAGFQIMAEGFGQVCSYMGTTSESTVSSVGQGWLDLMVAQEWVWQNIGNIAAYTWERTKLGAVRLFEDFKHLFSVKLPALWSWLSDDWGATWRTMLDYTLTILANLGENIRSAMSEIWNWIKSGGTDAMEFAWKPLTEGAVSAMKELPDIPERAISEFEKSLENQVGSMGDSLWTSLGEHMAKRSDELGVGPGGFKPTPAAQIAPLPTLSSAPMKTASATDAPKLAGAFVRGSVEEASLRNKIEAPAEFQKMVEQNKTMIEEEKKQTRSLDRIANNKPIPVGAS